MCPLKPVLYMEQCKLWCNLLQYRCNICVAFLQYLCIISAILCAIFLQYVCNISYQDVPFIFSYLFGKEEPYFSKFFSRSALCTVFLLLCETLFNFVGTVANGQCPPSNLLIHTSRFQVFDDPG